MVCQIARCHFSLWAGRVLSKRAPDLVLPRVFAGPHEPGECGHRWPESLYGRRSCDRTCNFRASRCLLHRWEDHALIRLEVEPGEELPRAPECSQVK